MMDTTFRSRLPVGDIRLATRTSVVAFVRGTGHDDPASLRQLPAGPGVKVLR
jgi:hypothetical protein